MPISRKDRINARHSRHEQLRRERGRVLIEEASKPAPEHFMADLDIKAAKGREITGYASTFGLPPDYHGDVIARGAFKETLSYWATSETRLPLLDSHGTDSIRSVVGYMAKGREDTQGLLTTFRILDGSDGDEILRRIEARLITGLSIGFVILDRRLPTVTEKAAGARRVLTQIELREISLVSSPANDRARLVAAAASLRSRQPLWNVELDSLSLQERIRVIRMRSLQMKVRGVLDWAGGNQKPLAAGRPGTPE